jgi:capsular polysaccharide export protein
MSVKTALVYAPPKGGKEPVLIHSSQELMDCSFVQLTKQQRDKALEFVSLWQQTQVSRYNRWHQMPELPDAYILVVLQDSLAESVQHAMLQHAIQKAAQLSVSKVLLCHEQHQTLVLPSSVQQLIAGSDAIQLSFCSESWHHASLIAKANTVICADSWLGFEALLWRKQVYSFLPSFFSILTQRCYELQQDVTAVSQLQPEVEQWVWHLFFQSAARVNYEVNPPQADQDIHSALIWLQLQRHTRQRFTETIYAIGFNHHWRHILKNFLQGSKLQFVKTPQQVPPYSQAVIWGRRDITKTLDPTVNLLRLEDGFLRSVGLGIQFSQPLSWVADTQGLYFDSTGPSDLETLLNEHPLGKELQQRAELLIQQLVNQGISKYNTGKQQWQKPATAKKIILVAGQVESDASIAFGAQDIKTNLGLLQAVRETNPDAYLIYKPHPDVVAGARASGANEQLSVKYCDLVLTDVNIISVIANVDEVHVLTSLSGFEALLRGKKVHCYGLPFYAGWGLTTDHCVCERRTRKLLLSQLVAATLLLYPLYISRYSGYYCTAEQTLAHLAEWRSHGISWRQKTGVLLRAMVNRIVGTK